MKKNKTLAIAIIALVIGYIAGDVIGIPAIDRKATTGDLNNIENGNPYKELLVAPEYMCFNKEYSGDQEAIRRTESTLNILYIQIRQFNSVCEFALGTTNNEKMSATQKKLEKASKENLEAFRACREAIDDLKSLQAGEEINLKKANAAAVKASKAINIHMTAGKAYVEAVDALAKDNTSISQNLANIRDMMANFCAADAGLCQNDAEIDYWSNTGSLKPDIDMAQK